MPSVGGSNPTTLPQDALAFWWHPCGVTWDAVREQSWLLKLRRIPAFMASCQLFGLRHLGRVQTLLGASGAGPGPGLRVDAWACHTSQKRHGPDNRPGPSS